MSDADVIRQRLAQRFGKRVSERQPAGRPYNGVMTSAAGYRDQDLAALPPDAVANALGAGNPIADTPLHAGETVADLGCGAGIDLLLAARKVGPTGRVIGVDMIDEMVAKARHNAADAGCDNIEVRQGLLEELPIPDGAVDWAVSNAAICLCPEKPRVFAEIARVLKPGGQTVITDVVVDPLPDAPVRPPSVREERLAVAASEHDYVAGLRAAGLEEVRVTERVAYDATLIEALIGTRGAVAGAVPAGDPAAVAERMVGRVGAIRVEAIKLAA